MSLEERDLTESIIGAAIEVHRTLGPGFLESVYEEALQVELKRRGIPHERQRETTISYKGVRVGVHRVDLLVKRRIVVELKATKEIDLVHIVVVRSYLQALRLDHGLILNFATAPLGIRRVFASTVYRSEAQDSRFPIS